MNALTVIDTDPADSQEWNKLCEVLRNWEPAPDQRSHRWKWLVKMLGYSTFARLATLPVARRDEVVNDLRRAVQIEPGLLAIISSEYPLDEVKAQGMTDTMLDELGL